MQETIIGSSRGLVQTNLENTAKQVTPDEKNQEKEHLLIHSAFVSNGYTISLLLLFL